MTVVYFHRRYRLTRRQTLMVLSSAYVSVSEFCIESGKSLMYIQKIMEPKSILVEPPVEEEEAVLMFFPI